MIEGELKLSPTIDFNTLKIMDKDAIRTVAVGLDKKTLLEKPVAGQVETVGSTMDVSIPKDIESAVNQFYGMDSKNLNEQVPTPVADVPVSNMPPTEPLPEANAENTASVPNVETASVPINPMETVNTPKIDIPLAGIPKEPEANSEGPKINIPLATMSQNSMETPAENNPLPDAMAPIAEVPAAQEPIALPEEPVEVAEEIVESEEPLSNDELNTGISQEEQAFQDVNSFDDNYKEALYYLNKARQLREEADVFEEMAAEKFKAKNK